MLEIVAAFSSGLSQAFSWPAIALLMLGIGVGAVVGLLPGLGGPAMLAMLIPFTLPLDPVSAFALLLGAASVTATTGDLSSILLGVPGEAVSAAVVVDGFAMARQGEAGRALGGALTGSLMGGVCGGIVLAAAVPIARPLMLSIGSPELFMLSVAGIAFIAPLVGSAPLKGLISGGVGVLLATVGLDSMHATPRFTFDSLFLWDGIGVLPVALGLLAIPEALALASSPAIRPPSTHIGGVTTGVRDAFRHWKLVLRCSVIGSYIGLLPGMGGSVAQWIAYAHATGDRRRDSRATGTIEGVLGPSAANNASIGGALIPTLMFGIPGSVTTAVLLGALIMKGVSPGDTMLLPEARGGHLAFVFSLIAFLVLANVIVVAVFMWLLGPLSRLTSIRGSLLFPMVLVLTMVGAFMEKNAIEDLAVVGATGALGWLMLMLDWPRPPLLLGLTLGGLAENRLFLSWNLYGFAWWRRPGVLVIGTLALLVVAHAIVVSRRARRPGHKRDVDLPRSAGRSRVSGDVVFILGLLAVAAVAWWASASFEMEARVFPRVVLTCLVGLLLAQLALEVRGRSVFHPSGPTAVSTTSRVTPSALLWAAASFAAVWMIGFAAGTAFVTMAYLRVGARETWGLSLAQAALVWTIVAGLLAQVLAVPFPDGVLLRLIASR